MREILRPVALALACLAMTGTPSQAQSILEFFGLVPKGDARQLPAPSHRLGTDGVGMYPPVAVTGDKAEPSARRAARATDAGSKVQTMCVRTCDGYYWPIRYPASRSDVAQDEASCRSSCGAEVKLYTRSDPGTDVEEMRDSEGRSYGASPTAYLYRKRLIDGCSCRPMPWSESEVARHERYALNEAEAKIRLAEAERLAAEQAAAAKSAVAAVGEPKVVANASGKVPGSLPQSDADVGAEQAKTRSRDDEVASNRPSVPGATRSAKPHSEHRVAEKPRPRQSRTAAAASKQQTAGLFGLSAAPAKYRYPGD